MHQALRADDLAAKGFADGLVSQANAEDGYLACHVPDKGNQDARFSRGAWPR